MGWTNEMASELRRRLKAIKGRQKDAGQPTYKDAVECLRLASHLDAAAARYEAEQGAVPELIKLARRVVEIFEPMQRKGQNGHTFELLLERAKKVLAQAQSDPPATEPRTVAVTDPAPS